MINWTKVVVDLNAYRGSTVQIRFRFDSIDAAGNAFAGWYVDDIGIDETILHLVPAMSGWAMSVLGWIMLLATASAVSLRRKARCKA
ncbi:hypothetical protein ACFL1X_07910 [Candidatus Hydrogenedentota bacterium]